jgi:hypothetical protein
MQEFTLPNVGARFKKWGCCKPILSKSQAHPQKYKIKIMLKNLEKGRQ